MGVTAGDCALYNIIYPCTSLCAHVCTGFVERAFWSFRLGTAVCLCDLGVVAYDTGPTGYQHLAASLQQQAV
eukprot:m.88363 g.88363  ORF g.88363 m.88363 type:complete len:72 (+) comp9751_c1_seq1:263-478(+)